MNKRFIRQVFSDKNYQGNTAFSWLCKSKSEFEDTQFLQQIAKDNKLSATAFILLKDQSLNSYHIRWFSPLQEIQFCGHATLAVADVILTDLTTNLTKLYLYYAGNEIKVVKTKSNNYSMHLTRINLVPGLLSCSLMKLFDAKITNVKQTHAEDGYLIIQLNDKASIANFDLKSNEYSKLTKRALIITAQEKSEPQQLYFRYFAPQYGVKEDPATGSAASVLAEFWQLPLNKIFDCVQLSEKKAFYQVSRTTEHVNIWATVTRVD